MYRNRSQRQPPKVVACTFGSKTEFFAMNQNENAEKTLNIRETHPKRTLPLTEALEDYGNACDTDGKKSCSSSVWLCAVMLFFIVGCLAFQQRPEKQQIHAPETVQKPLNISPYLTLNIPKQPFRLADLKNDAIRDAFDTSEENFIESQTGQEFSYRKNVLFDDRAKTVASKHGAFALPNDTKFIYKWLQAQHIRDITYKNFESHLSFNDRIFHLNDIVSPQYRIKWCDIDPIDKKIFFSDVDNNRYAISF